MKILSNTNLLNMLPPVFKSIKDIELIMKAEQEEMDCAIELTEQVQNNLFIKTCDEPTIVLYENLFDITPPPQATLTYRRQAILNAFNTFRPYTIETLKQKLNGLVESIEDYDIIIDYENFEITIMLHQKDYVTQDFIMMIQNLILQMAPAHLITNVKIGGKVTVEQDMYYGTATTISNIVNIDFE